MKNQRRITFADVDIFVRGLPPELVGEFVQALLGTMGKKYGSSEFELDYDIIDGQLQTLLGYINKGLPYDTIIDKLKKQSKIYSEVWEKINKSIVKHIPNEEDRIGAFRILITNGQAYIETSKGATEIENPKRPATEAPELPYAPNRKYQDQHFKRFEELYALKKSQSEAYVELGKEFPKAIDLTKEQSFLVSFRQYLKSKGAKEQK